MRKLFTLRTAAKRPDKADKLAAGTLFTLYLIWLAQKMWQEHKIQRDFEATLDAMRDSNEKPSTPSPL